MNIERDTGRRPPRFMAYLHIVMGIVFLVFGVLVFTKHTFGTMALVAWQTYGLGSLFILYGLFRLWRGITDLRARNDYDDHY